MLISMKINIILIFLDLHIEHKCAFNGLKDKYYTEKKHFKRFNTIINGIKDKQKIRKKFLFINIKINFG